MDNSYQKNPQVVSWWITSLAMSIICCAVLFVIFAGYLTDMKKEMNAENAQLTQMSLQQDLVLAEVKSLKHALNGNATPAVAPGVTHAAVPAAESAPAAATATSPVTPPAAAPTAVPEIPSTK